ncbi:MAG: S16 family serine protease [Ilumatobacteraceae bacterium]
MPTRKHRWWAVPLALIGIATPVGALVCNGIQVDHWAVAPGEASPVGSRLDFENLPDGVVEDDSPGQFLFVTVTGAHLNVLQFALGGNDDDVRVLTREQRFGKDDPGQERQIGLQMMRDAKDVAEYVAYQRLGLGARLRAGEVVVAHLLCLNGEITKSDDCDTPAPAAGLLERGSTITAVDGVPTPTVDDLGPVMEKRQPGDEVTVTYRPIQGGEEKIATFRTIASRETAGAPSRALIGFIAHDTYSVELPFRAEIDTDSIGGPSAGLAFTLSLIDRLSPGSLTGGQKVAVTGTIQDDGSVGAIGGLRQKVVAVRRSGARFMLVPTAQGDQGDDGLIEARRAAGDDLEIVPVANIEEALAALAARGGTPLRAVNSK